MGFSWKRGLAAAPILAYLAGAPLARAEALDVAFELGPLDVFGPGDHMLALGAGVFIRRRERAVFDAHAATLQTQLERLTAA